MRTVLPSVTVTPRPLWRIRLARSLPRYLLGALALWGLLASMRFAIDPPRPLSAAAPPQTHTSQDLAAEGFACLFARRYLTWESQNPGSHQQSLAAFVGTQTEPDAGITLTVGAEQRVQWTQVVQEREPASGEHVYTVAAQTDSAGLLYLTVSVMRKQNGSLALADYPAFVGAPASEADAVGSPGNTQGSREVGDRALRTVVTRALRNYLARASSELAADLAEGARVSLPGPKLSLRGVQQVLSLPGDRSVRVVLMAADERGIQYTLAYELDVAHEGGRWEVSAIQMNPDE